MNTAQDPAPNALPPILRFDIVSLFPEFFVPWQSLGVCGRAVAQQRVQVAHWNPRQFVHDSHQTIDDRPYGGGPGMVMMAPPLAACVNAVRQNLIHTHYEPGMVILFSPAGAVLTQDWVERQRMQILNRSSETPAAQFTLICGRYEGVDQRFIDHYVDQEISLGDYVVSGGEIAALALMDSIVRRLPGVLNDELSSVTESFMTPQLDHPHYTRPEVFEGETVPAVLLSGHHGKIEGWRRDQALLLTQCRRPDLVKRSNR
jgi:tRNA (guanine37-N1)-methyltransferase